MSKSSKKSPSLSPEIYMVLGHSCTLPENPDFIIPKNVDYITTGICGLTTSIKGLNGELIDEFFRKNEYIESSDATQILHIDPFIRTSHKDSFEDRSFIVVNKTNEAVSQSMYRFLITHIYHDDTNISLWQAIKSGVYKYGEKLNTERILHPVVLIPFRNDQNVRRVTITKSQIERIFEGSIYPTAKYVIKQINKFLKARKGGELFNDDDTCLIGEFEYVMSKIQISLSDLVSRLQTKHKHPIRLYDPLCKTDCYMLGTDMTEYQAEMDKRRKTQENQLAKERIGQSLLAEIDKGGKSRKHKRKISQKKKTRRL